MPRKGTRHTAKSSKRNTQCKLKDKKEEKKLQFAGDQEQINCIQKRKPNDFGITYEVRKIINM